MRKASKEAAGKTKERVERYHRDVICIEISTHFCFGSFVFELSFREVHRMVLSLTADNLVQAHFDALVAEGERKQVRVGEG